MIQSIARKELGETLGKISTADRGRCGGGTRRPRIN